MHFWAISLFPELFTAFAKQGIIGRAIVNAQATLTLINPRDFAQGNYRRVDDRPFGGGPGMVMMAQPLEQAILSAKNQATIKGCIDCPVVYLSPQGQALSESSVCSFGAVDGMVLLCGRYEGVDERLLNKYVDIEVSIGDYVLTGGELPAMVLMDSVIRRLPNVMNDECSAKQDSFVDGLLDCPHYTHPAVYDGIPVPDVLLTGHHQNIAKWRFLEQLSRTKSRREDLYQAFLTKADTLSSERQKWLLEFLDTAGSQ